jgi:hypothetical protein
MRQPEVLEQSREGIMPDSLAAHGAVRELAPGQIAPKTGKNG